VVLPPAAAPQPAREIHDIPEPPAAATEKADEATGSGQVRVAAELLDRLVNASGEVSIFRSRLEQQVSGLRSNLGEFDETLARMREQFRKLEIEIDSRIRSSATRSPQAGSPGFDPLEMDEFSTLHQLSRGMSESVADLMNLQEMLEDNARKSEQLLLQQSRVATDLQEGLMRTRMVPFGSVAPRLRRIVRSAAAESGRKARLQLHMVGTSDALDRNVLEHITAPLEHMMRNAVVHGIEPPKQRTAAGKAAEGEISVTVESEATEFVIHIEDDGAGINLDAIRERAIQRGLLTADAEPRPEQLYEFILDSGFSTTDSVTNLAGRGVGMDVVSSEIKQIGGSLEIASESGKGTKFTIRIPFTLAVMQAIGVIAGKQRYLLPLTSVVGVSRMQPEEYSALVAQDNPVYRFAGQEYPVLDLETVLGEPARPLDRNNVSLLILRAGEQKAAFRVVELLPHREIVIKPVGPQISCVPGILGGSISANGEVMVILDPGPMIRHARLHPVSIAPVAQPVIDQDEHPVAMVVDDSITMRKVTSRVLEGHGFEVITARDGVDALEQLQERTPAILLLDIEMPRMDGYELAQHVRDDVRLRHIPIIMITSRAGQKHRDRAAQVGANAYLSKPYAESELLNEVQRLLRDGTD
jgi:chemosensory pili system protein ChpA (sensor histidine kinase/response regulator)